MGDAEATIASGVGSLDRLAAEQDQAGARPEQARDRPQHGGLARSVRADQGDELALPTLSETSFRTRVLPW